MSRQSETELDLPLQHLAIIMDGNGRWAKRQGLPRIAGHQRGVETVIQVVDECLKTGIRYLSLFAFSSENWGRPQQEVDALMKLLLHFLASQQTKMLSSGICLRVIGDRNRLSDSVRRAIAETEAQTAAGDALTLVLALSYGSRDEILRAAKKLAVQAVAGELDLENFNNKQFSALLDTGEIPEPDLLIRTSGEKRISNFLLWQAAYAELYFTDTLWPDFDAQELSRALQDYRQRQRRFGLTDDQLELSVEHSGEGESH